MTQTLDARPLPSKLRDFIAGLKALEKDPITTTRVSRFFAAERPSAEALAPYLFWSTDHYTRNLIYRDAFFEVLALCWLPGQHTPIHSHNGQLGWVSVLRGELICRDYRFVRSPNADPSELPRPSLSHRSLADRSAEDRIVADPSRAGLRHVGVELLAQESCQADGPVSIVDRRQTTHQLENLEKSRHGTVSLHIYSKPIDCCVLFDETRRCCERRQLQYYSADGVILEANGLEVHRMPKADNIEQPNRIEEKRPGREGLAPLEHSRCA